MDGSAERAWFVLGVSLHYADTFSQSGHFFGAHAVPKLSSSGINDSLFPTHQIDAIIAPLSLLVSRPHSELGCVCPFASSTCSATCSTTESYISSRQRKASTLQERVSNRSRSHCRAN